MKDDGKRELGKVESVTLLIEDHGILTLMMSINFGGEIQGFGGYALDAPPRDGRGYPREGAAAGTDYILRLLRLFQVSCLDEIEGRAVYALRERGTLNDPIIGLELPEFDGGGKFLIADWQQRWFPGEGKS